MHTLLFWWDGDEHPAPRTFENEAKAHAHAKALSLRVRGHCQVLAGQNVVADYRAGEMV